MSFKEVQAHTSRFGGSSLTETELSEIFKHFDSAQDNQVGGVRLPGLGRDACSPCTPINYAAS